MIQPYYEQDGITIFNADCLDVLPTLEQVDHVITDPPYEVEAHTLGRRSRVGGVVQERPLDFDGMTDRVRCAAGREIARLSSGWALVFCQVEAAMVWRDALSPARYVRTQIWRKSNGAPQFTGDRPGMGYESIVTCWCGDGRMKWNGGGRHGIYDHGVVQVATRHMTEKPLPLMRDLVSLFTDSGDLILDPFMGSGTTLRAAKDLGRRAIGIELNEDYCRIAVERLRQGVLL